MCVRRSVGDSKIQSLSQENHYEKHYSKRGKECWGKFKTVCSGKASLRRCHQSKDLKKVSFLGEVEVQRPSEWDLHHRLPWFSGLWIQTGMISLAFLGLQFAEGVL